MYCPVCGAAVSGKAKFCRACGSLQGQHSAVSPPAAGSSLVGFSPKISDPALARYLRQSNYWAIIFALILAVVAIVGFYIAGERGTEPDNPESLYIGLGIGGMFMTIALFQVLNRKRGKTFDGTVADKHVRKKSRRHEYGDGDYRYVDYLLYTVVVRSDSGKKHFIRVENDDTRYQYYQIGDRVRYHGGLKSYEKYDKSNDQIIFCNACGTLCDIADDHCFRCKCPLLK